MTTRWSSASGSPTREVPPRVDDGDVVWLCAVRRREDGSDDHAFEWFAELHQAGRLLPTDDDRLRDRAEEAVHTDRRLRRGLFALVDQALGEPGRELQGDLDG